MWPTWFALVVSSFSSIDCTPPAALLRQAVQLADPRVLVDRRLQHSDQRRRALVPVVGRGGPRMNRLA
jgi:hypothetical protein